MPAPPIYSPSIAPFGVLHALRIMQGSLSSPASSTSPPNVPLSAARTDAPEASERGACLQLKGVGGGTCEQLQLVWAGPLGHMLGLWEARLRGVPCARARRAPWPWASLELSLVPASPMSPLQTQESLTTPGSQKVVGLRDHGRYDQIWDVHSR